MNGIDISSHNGNINYNMLKNSGIKYVYIKATEGVNFKDSRYLEYANNIKAIGLKFGFYHFMSEKTDPTQQAIDFYNAIKNIGYNLIPVLDIETNNLGRNRTQISDRCLTFLNKFKQLSNQDCIIYTGAYFGRDNLDNRLKDKYKGWIAHYGVSSPMDTGFKVVGHQYSETSRINGINGNVDANNFTNDIELNNRKNFKITATANIQHDGIKNYNGVNHILIGTVGQSKRLEAISINISDIDISYDVHMEKVGDLKGSIEGQVEGSIGQAKRLEGITINVKNIPKGYKLLYRTHIENQGWGNWCNSGEYSGTKGKGLRMEAVEIKIE